MLNPRKLTSLLAGTKTTIRVDEQTLPGYRPFTINLLGGDAKITPPKSIVERRGDLSVRI